MLAVKLHKAKRPNLGKGSFLIPIHDWRSGQQQIGNWIRTLTNDRRQGYLKASLPGRENGILRGQRPNNAIRFITLVKIPDRHPVFIGLHYADKWEDKVEYTPLANIDTALKKKLDLMQRYVVRVYPDGSVLSARAMFPELILGEPLPPSCVKWTKDILLLHRGNKRLSRRGHYSSCKSDD